MHHFEAFALKVNELYLIWGLEPNFNVYKAIILFLYSLAYISYVTYLYKKYNGNDFMIVSDKKLQYMILLYIVLIAYMLNMYEVILFIILLIGFIFIVVRNKKYKHLKTFIDEYIL